MRSCQTYIRQAAKDRKTDCPEEVIKRLKACIFPPADSKDEDRRIKVAIIDNGVDRFEESLEDKIANGISFVAAKTGNRDRMLPWWMVSDPHGTQMASLVVQANPFVRLYIARVGVGRKDILPELGAEVRIPSHPPLFSAPHARFCGRLAAMLARSTRANLRPKRKGHVPEPYLLSYGEGGRN